MSSFPACKVCRKEFTPRGPAPLVLPCLHAVCEVCVKSNSVIFCPSCKISINHKRTHLHTDHVRKREILQVAIKERPEQLNCTHEDDGNRAVCWCQDCEEMLCEHCQKMHQSFKVTRGHTVLDVDQAMPITEAEVKNCSTHKRYPLDTFDKTCKIFICVRCIRDDHAHHETVDIEKLEEGFKKIFQNQLKEITSVERHEEAMLKKTLSHMTSIQKVESETKRKVAASFKTLRQLLDQREVEVLQSLKQQSQQIQKEAEVTRSKIMSNHADCKRVKEYISLVLQYPTQHTILPIRAAIEEKMKSIINTQSKVGEVDRLPNFNPSGEDILKTYISTFGDIKEIKNDTQAARGRPGGQAGGSMEESWNTVSSKAIRNIDRNIDVTKLRIEKNADENIQLQLGPARSFGGWGRGSSGGCSRVSQEGEKPKAQGNRYSAMSKEDDQRSRAFGRGVSPARGEGRMRGNQPGGGFNRGKVIPRSSQEQERERALASARSLVSGRTTPPSGTTSREGSRNRGGATHEVERPPAPVRELSEDEMEKKTHSIVDEYLHIQDRKEAIQCVQELNSPKTTHFFVYFAINHVLERSKQARQQTGHLLHDLINQKVISVDTYLQGLTEILQAAEDMEEDIPKIWLYLGELIGPMIQDGSVPLSFLTKACEPLKVSGKAGNLMAEVLHDASQRLGHKIVAHLWRNNMMDWTDFVSQEKLQQFLKDKNLEFTVGPDSAPSTPTSKVSIEWITQNLSTLLNDPKCDNEQTFDWIEANIPDEITKENKFIRALMSSVCSSAISGSDTAARVDPEVVKKWRALLTKYFDHSAVFELQALYALQALVNSLRHPSGVLRSFFDILYDEEIISEDAFNQWETSQEEPEGKGVALKQVVQFFAWLQEEEEEEADS